jgi:hypothetical protein
MPALPQIFIANVTGTQLGDGSRIGDQSAVAAGSDRNSDTCFDGRIADYLGAVDPQSC